jgi:hypothetical protein
MGKGWRAGDVGRDLSEQRHTVTVMNFRDRSGGRPLNDGPARPLPDPDSHLLPPDSGSPVPRTYF